MAIVDHCDIDYIICQTLSVLLYNVQRMLARQRKHIAVRRGLLDDASDDGETASRTSVHYLASQYLTDSSLNTDVSQFDFATSVSHSNTFITFVNMYSLSLASLTFVKNVN